MAPTSLARAAAAALVVLLCAAFAAQPVSPGADAFVFSNLLTIPPSELLVPEFRADLERISGSLAEVLATGACPDCSARSVGLVNDALGGVPDVEGSGLGRLKALAAMMVDFAVSAPLVPAPMREALLSQLSRAAAVASTLPPLNATRVVERHAATQAAGAGALATPYCGTRTAKFCENKAAESEPLCEGAPRLVKQVEVSRGILIARMYFRLMNSIRNILLGIILIVADLVDMGLNFASVLGTAAAVNVNSPVTDTVYVVVAFGDAVKSAFELSIEAVRTHYFRECGVDMAGILPNA